MNKKSKKECIDPSKLFVLGLGLCAEGYGVLGKKYGIYTLGNLDIKNCKKPKKIGINVKSSQKIINEICVLFCSTEAIDNTIKKLKNMKSLMKKHKTLKGDK